MEMTEKEQKTMFISAYMNLQRVKVSEDKDKEIRNQERELKAKLEALGVVVEELTIEQPPKGTGLSPFFFIE